MSHQHRAWLVDLDGTLYRPLPVKAAMAAELIVSGRRAVATLRRFRQEHELVRSLDTEDDVSPYQAQINRTAAALGLDARDVEATVFHWMHERPGRWIRAFRRHALIGEIDAFRRTGGKTAVVSDYPARTKLRALFDQPPFDAIVASGEVGGPRRLKPDPDGFLEAARRLDVPPEECLVIGDRDDADGAAARAARMDFRHVR